ncbi:Cytochrome P450 9e2 [Papilio machaon]|uniref:unspecific monooxygenase n=1 Tax=Papilio machaon TaxID=76193 RepID=A0A194QT13_PAPMA|nr:Cytochrome P450 9e2 [Papilio machaon]
MDIITQNKILSYILDEWKILLFLVAIYLLYYYGTYNYDYFEKKGISYIKPTIFVGSLWMRVTKQISYQNYQLYVYNYFKGKPFGGIFLGRRPTLFLIDPDLIKAVTTRDFEYFVDRNSLETNEPRFLKRTLLNLKGSQWKAVRSSITPSFSSSRLKNMIPLIQQSSDQMVKFLQQYDKSDVEMKDLVGHLTLEVIGACAFGIKTDALTDENAHFVKLAKQFGDITTKRKIFLLIFIMFMPNLMKYFNLSFLNTEAIEELVKVLKVTKAERRKAESKKRDFLQQIIEAADKEREEVEKTGGVIQLDEDTIDGQSFLFLIAGYETSSTLLSFGIHILAVNPDLQNKLREHILQVTEGKEITYDLLTELDYLEGFLLETLRLHPPLSRVDRVCVKDYILPGTNVKLEAGQVVAIPVYGVHMDPDIYPEPSEFRPERFMGEERKNRPSHLYLAFGAGPRNCIGMRFAMISAKIAMVSLLKNFKFSPCAKTENPVTIDMDSVLLKPAAGLWVKIDKL